MTDTKHALITGITGQDGSYLAELLLQKGYEVSGIVREESGMRNIKSSESSLTLIHGDIRSEAFVDKIVRKEYDEIYNLASVASVSDPWKDSLQVTKITALVPLFFLDALRRRSPRTRFFQASSAEMYGNAEESPQSEETPFHPINPYGAGKLYAHTMVENYRTLGIFAVSGILFNHESPRRPDGFVTRKITSTLARIKKGSEEVLKLGNLDAMRDWGFAGDYVEGIWKSLQIDTPDTFVFASGAMHSVREFVKEAAEAAGLSISWEGTGIGEVGKDQTGRVIVAVGPAFFRPLDTHKRQGDITKAGKILDWKPRVSFKELVRMMVEEDLKHA